MHLAAATAGDESEEQGSKRLLYLLAHVGSSVWQALKGQCIWMRSGLSFRPHVEVPKARHLLVSASSLRSA
jgi:hypothetical protein